jgi:hypothetical protein
MDNADEFTLAKIEVLVEQSVNKATNESKVDLLVQMIRFSGREKHKKMKSALLKRPYPQNRQRKLINSNFLYKIFLEINLSKRNLLKRNHLNSYPLKMNRYLKIMRSQ